MSSTKNSHGPPRPPDAKPTAPASPRRRLLVMLVVMMLLFGIVVGRLTQLQVISSHQYDEYGLAQRTHHVTLSAERGSIFDRYGHDLALTVPQQTIWADPTAVKDAYQEAAVLAPILGSDVATLEPLLRSDGKRKFVYLARRVDDAVAKRVKDLKLPGIAMYEEPKRFLPGDSDLSSVIGAVGSENEGLSGLEFQYNKQLSGRPGTLFVEQDLAGRDIPGGLRQETAPVRGDDMVLTIDRDLQFKVEDALRQEVTRANAKGGIAAVMDTKSGEVLALANLSVPGDGKGSPVEPARSNLALTNVYEPGSVSKLITVSAALENKIITPSTTFTVPYDMKVADSTFHDADPHPTEHWTTTDILTASSNVGTIQIAQRLGKDRLDQFQRAFGYGTPTGLKYPGESPGLILDPKSKHYSGTSLATSAIGQGVSVTAMQMLAAYNTMANDGVYVAPKLVKATVDSKGKQHPTTASASRRVVSSETAAQMNRMLQEVVRVGTATAAQISGYDVAGKTGTAGKPKANGAGYDNYVSTFAGFVPAANPQLTAIVILDEPTPIFGGLVAAPVFSDVVRYALQEYGIAPVPQGDDRHGVPPAAPTASSAASESDASPGITADAANEATANANRNRSSGGSTTSSTSSTSTTVRQGGTTTTTVARSTTTAPQRNSTADTGQ